MHPLKSAYVRPAAVLSFVLLLVGCGGRGDISGTVSYKGKNLVFGTIQMEGSDHLVRSGRINLDGSYSVVDVASGEAKVSIYSSNPESSENRPPQRLKDAPAKRKRE